MRVTKEIKLEDFNAWNGAVDTLDRLKALDLCDVVEDYITEIELTDETSINDFLWFEIDFIITDVLSMTEDEFYNETSVR